MNIKGQSVVEAMIAISILTIGFLGVTALLVRSFALSRVTSDQLTATYLASEGIEVTKNILDHDVYAGLAWGTCGGTCGADGAYTVEYNSQVVAPIPGALDCSPLYLGSVPALDLDPSTGLYEYGTGSPTKFQRCIHVAHDATGNEITVSSVVTWTSNGITNQNVNLEDHFYDWHP